MKETTKKDFKDSFETFLIIMFSIVFVSSVNRQCAGIAQKAAAAQIEKMQIEKRQIMDLQKVR